MKSEMTLNDHRAAACELNNIARGVALFESIAHGRRRIPKRIFTSIGRIRKAIEKIRVEMEALRELTLSGENRRDLCWEEPAAETPPAPNPVPAMTIAEHIESARALGEAWRACDRLLDIIGGRKHLSVRVIDWALSIRDQIHRVRSEMDDVQSLTLHGRDRYIDCWLGHFNHFDGDVPVEVTTTTSLEATHGTNS